MNLSERMLLFAISESEPARFAEISIRTRMRTDYLDLKLDDLQSRGFIKLWDGKYTLAKGVKESLLN